MAKITRVDLSTNFAAWGAGRVNVNVSCSFVNCIDQLGKVHRRRNALGVGPDDISSGNSAGHGPGSSIWARWGAGEAGWRTTGSAGSRTAQEYHHSAIFFGKSKVDVWAFRLA